MKTGSFDAFVKLVMDRYDDEERAVIIEASKKGKDGLTHLERMLYERALGKGNVPSGVHYDDFNIDAIKRHMGSLLKNR